MKKLPFSQEYLLETYKRDLDKMLDICDWKSHVDDNDICEIITNICVNNSVNITFEELITLYKEKVASLNLTREQWVTEFGSWETGVPKIIGMIYEILENYHK